MTKNNNVFIRVSAQRGLAPVRFQVATPDKYDVCILNNIKYLNPTAVVDFISGASVVHTANVKTVQSVISKVHSVVNGDGFKSKLDNSEKDTINNAMPWDFWKNKELQEIINKAI